MRSRAKPSVNVVDFPPPVTGGQKKWKWRIAAHVLLKNLPNDPEERDDAIAVADMIKSTIGECSQRGWQREQQAAYVISMLPEDREAARQIINKFLKPFLPRDE